MPDPTCLRTGLPGSPGDGVTEAARPAEMTIRQPSTLPLQWGQGTVWLLSQRPRQNKGLFTDSASLPRG